MKKLKNETYTLEDRASDMAADYSCHLQETIKNSLSAYHGGHLGRYASWTLSDCMDMRQFYSLVHCKQFRQAFKKMRYLEKECSLVPNDLGKLLWKIAAKNGYDDIY